MKPEHWALIGVVVGAIIGAGAQVLAGSLQGRRDRKSELRRVKREAYLAFVDAVTDHAVTVAITIMARSIGTSLVDFPGLKPDSLAKLTKAHAAVLLYGAAPVQRATGAFRVFLNEALDKTITLPKPWNDSVLAETIGREMAPATKHHATCLRAMREDLGIEGDLVQLDLLQMIVSGVQGEDRRGRWGRR